jgi:ribosomal protein S16
MDSRTHLDAAIINRLYTFHPSHVEKSVRVIHA